MLNKHLKEFFEMAQIKNEVLMYKELLFLQLEKKTSIHKKIKYAAPAILIDSFKFWAWDVHMWFHESHESRFMKLFSWE